MRHLVVHWDVDLGPCLTSELGEAQAGFRPVFLASMSCVRESGSPGRSRQT